MWQVYNLFRQLGLRHIFVVPHPSRVLGMITRKDLLLEVPDVLITDDYWMPLLIYILIQLYFMFQENDSSATMELQSSSVRSLCFSCTYYLTI